jgi:hypothetical protein
LNFASIPVGLVLAALLVLTPGRAAIISSTTSFETLSNGVCTNGSVIEGWLVTSNEVSIVTDPAGAYSGDNYLALGSGHITKAFTTQPGAAYQLQFHGKGFGLTHWWPGDNDAKDIIGTNKGTLQNVTFDTGKVSQAFAFSGKKSEVDFGADIANFGTSDFTVDFWIKQPPDATYLTSILEKRHQCDSSVNFWDIRCGHVWNAPDSRPGQLFFEDTDNGTANYVILVANKPINDGLFHHAAFTRNGLTLSLYIDGVLDAKITAPGIANINNTDVFKAGQNICVGIDGSQPFVGDLDELDLFNRALSPAEIYAIHLAGTDGKYGPVSTLMPNLQLTIDGVMTNTIILDEAAGPWQLFTNNFTAKKSRVTIGLEGNALGVLIDDIQLVPQPAP